MNFLDAVLSGNAFLEEIDDFVDAWHNSDSDLEIYDYLGLSFDEYSIWVEQPQLLSMVINSKRFKKSLETVQGAESIHTLAARSLASDDVNSLLIWLEENNYI
jgi:hypothetical protein